MLFTSSAFIAFLAVLFVLYYLIPKKTQWVLLLVASYLFYFWAGPKYLIYIAVTTVSTYFAAGRISRQSQALAADLAARAGLSRQEKKLLREAGKAKQRHWLLACLLFNFAILAAVKYTNFALANINSLLELFGAGKQLSYLNLILPMGISFYTFQSMAYLIDVYRGKHQAQDNIFKFALFVSFFPQLVQGPISRYSDLAQSLYSEHELDWRQISFGLQRILWGFFKKLVIADRILLAVNTIIRDPGNYDGGFVFLGMLFYALQLYADFTGGIDITLGIAQVLGIKLAENFNAPFLARSITDFWRRWHITMGSWFRDYLFYPLSVSRPMLNFSRKARQRLGDAFGKRLPVYLVTLVTWFATGIWHGSSWNFIAWGLTNGIVIIISQEFEPLYARFHKRFKVKDQPLYIAFTIIRTTLLMSAIRMFDCYRNVGLTIKMFWSMLTSFKLGRLLSFDFRLLGLSGADYILLALATGLLLATGIRRPAGSMENRLAKIPLGWRYAAIYGLILAILIFGAYGSGYDASQFIYNQF